MEAGVGADCAIVQISSVDDALHAESLGTPRSHSRSLSPARYFHQVFQDGAMHIEWCHLQCNSVMFQTRSCG